MIERECPGLKFPKVGTSDGESDYSLSESIPQVLAAFLLHELSKGETSFWYPYLHSLPRQYTSLSYFSTAEAEELQVTPEDLNALPCISQVLSAVIQG